MAFTIFSLACPDKSHGSVGLVDPDKKYVLSKQRNQQKMIREIH